MDQCKALCRRLDLEFTAWSARWGIPLLRISIGIVFFWFGFKKFFPGASPAEELATTTFGLMTFGIITGTAARVILASWETVIGIGLIFKIFPRTILILFFLQMVGAFAPMVLLPDVAYQRFPFVLTMEGQYIVKNIVLIAAAIVIWGAGGALTHTKPVVTQGKR